jgi:hypothetical protein
VRAFCTWRVLSIVFCIAFRLFRSLTAMQNIIIPFSTRLGEPARLAGKTEAAINQVEGIKKDLQTDLL